MRSFQIKPVLNGFIVDVGCSSVVFTSKEDLLENIKQYLETPDKMEKEYRKNGLNTKHFFPVDGPQYCESPQEDCKVPNPAYKNPVYPIIK